MAIRRYEADDPSPYKQMSVTFIGMVIPYLKTRPMLVAVIVSGALSVVANPLPHKLGLMIAAIAGITAGVLTERTARQKS